MGQLSYRNEDIVNERQASLDYLPEITNRILKVSDPEMIILFGSYARGDFGMDSDLDLLVVLKGVESPRKTSSLPLRNKLNDTGIMWVLYIVQYLEKVK